MRWSRFARSVDLNLEAHQGKIKRRYGDDVTIPIPYFTQLIGMALGLSEKALGLEKLLVPLAGT